MGAGQGRRRLSAMPKVAAGAELGLADGAVCQGGTARGERRQEGLRHPPPHLRHPFLPSETDNAPQHCAESCHARSRSRLPSCVQRTRSQVSIFLVSSTPCSLQQTSIFSR